MARVVPFTRAVVWDGFDDHVLVQGWLAPSAVPVVGPQHAIAVTGAPLPGGGTGELRSIHPGASALLDLGLAGVIRFELAEGAILPNGRGSTVCTATGAPAHDLAAVGLARAIEARLDALAELLAGRPVDWSTVGPAQSRPTNAR